MMPAPMLLPTMAAMPNQMPRTWSNRPRETAPDIVTAGRIRLRLARGKDNGQGKAGEHQVTRFRRGVLDGLYCHRSGMRARPRRVPRRRGLASFAVLRR